jgi:Zn ribbon nucleic-acid-binding protein
MRIEIRECLACGHPIHPERLEYLPSTVYCTACAVKYPTPPRHDPNVVCVKASLSCSNGFAPNDSAGDME